MTRDLAVIILAAGRGTRTKVSVPKVLLPLCGRPVAAWVADAAAALQPAHTVLVLHHERARVEAGLRLGGSVRVVDQGTPRGTGHAVRVALEALPDGFAGDVVVLNGDCPLITAESLQALRAAATGHAAALLSATVAVPDGLGRVLRDAGGDLAGIREDRDCDDDERRIDEVNAGFYCFDAVALRGALGRLGSANAGGEEYLTEAFELLLADGAEIAAFELEDASEAVGINDLADLALARAVLQERILLEHLANGVIIDDPSTTYIEHDVEIGPGTRVLPCTVIDAGVRIGAGCTVGPFAHLAGGAQLGDGVEVGNFVEVKRSTLGAGTKAKHLAYLGDTTTGAAVNIGAGTITANYDGRAKHRTVLGDGASTGSNTVLVAPAELGAGARTGAGAVVTRPVAAGETVVGVPARSLAARHGTPPAGAERGSSDAGGSR